MIYSMRGLSIDIGVHNLALYIEEFDSQALSLLKQDFPPEKKRYQFNNELVPACIPLFQQVYRNGTCIFMDKVNLCQEKGTRFNMTIFYNLTLYLHSIQSYIDTCSFVVIEEQLKRNPMAQRVEQHCISWILIHYLALPIIRFPSRNKTNVLGAPRLKLDPKTQKYIKWKKSERKPFIKKWSCEKAKEILTLRGDSTTYKYIFTDRKKQDDLSDVITQMMAFKVKCFIDHKLT